MAYKLQTTIISTTIHLPVNFNPKHSSLNLNDKIPKKERKTKTKHRICLHPNHNNSEN